ncbi:MAG: hypothetical protein LBU37_02250 [Tannerellaceae bacterium]|jgi:hypothetical protein|nr:hypothetical protein [Tannerellaceae bacterium]
MADIESIKISQLPEALTTSDSDAVLVVQGNKAKKARPSLFKGKKGDPGENAYLRYYGGWVQWRLGVSGNWVNLIPVSELKGDSAYQTAVNNGFKGTEQEWIASLSAASESAAAIADAAATAANTAATAASQATTAATSAATAANTAKDNTIMATTAATAATTAATSAATSATAAANNANSKATAADLAATSATQAAGNANTKAALAETKAGEANAAAGTANQVVLEARETITRMEGLAESIVGEYKLIPQEMVLDYPKVVTYRNTVAGKIHYTLLPADTGRNVLFLGDDNAVTVLPNGDFMALKPGISRIHAIPTENTLIYQTIQITVVAAGLRKVKSNSLRFTGNGSLRFT